MHHAYIADIVGDEPKHTFLPLQNRLQRYYKGSKMPNKITRKISIFNNFYKQEKNKSFPKQNKQVLIYNTLRFSIKAKVFQNRNQAAYIGTLSQKRGEKKTRISTNNISNPYQLGAKLQNIVEIRKKTSYFLQKKSCSRHRRRAHLIYIIFWFRKPPHSSTCPQVHHQYV